MAVTDLLSKGTFSRRGTRAERPSGAGAVPGASAPSVPSSVPPSLDALFEASAPPRATARRRTRRPMPSRAVLIIGGLALTTLTLAGALVVDASRPASVATPTVVPATTAAAGGTTPAVPMPAEPPATPATSGADARPVPADLIAALEAAADAPLAAELRAFLVAVDHSFGGASAQLDPALRPFAYRLASRFEWNPDAFAVSIAAPDASLAAARRATLEGLFSEAVAAGRLTLRTTTGPDAVSLVTD